MPQLIPFYFLNQTICSLILIFFLLYVFSIYILPVFIRTNATRFFLTTVKKQHLFNK